MSDLSELTTEGDDATHGPNDVNTGRTGPKEEPSVVPRTPTSRAPFDFSLKLDLQAATLRAAAVAAAVPAATPAAVEPPEPVLDLSMIPEMVQVDAVMPAMVTTPDMLDSSFVSRATLPMLPKTVTRHATNETSNIEPRMAPGSRLSLQPTPVAATLRSNHNESRFVKIAVVLVIVLGLLGGAIYVLLQKRSASQAKVWPTEVAPLATFVESTLEHTFKHAVPVRSLPQAEYEAKLGIYLLERVPRDSSGGFSGLRALGLIDDDPTAADVGQYIGTARAAFYDPTTTTIYHPTDSDSAETDAGLVAAMSAALIDQYKNWGEAMSAMSPSQRIGYLSMIEGVGAFAIREKARQDSAFATAYVTAHAARVARQVALGTQLSPWIVGLLDMQTPASLAVVTRSLEPGFVDALNAPTSDAAVLDSARGLQTPALAPTVEQSTVGMYFWYGVLYPALGSVDAFRLASAWSGDSVIYTSTDGRGCIRGSVATRDAASLAALVGGLNTWALSRPASSMTTVAARGTVAVVNACEPVEATAVDRASAVGMDFHARLSTEQVLLQQLSRLMMPLTAPTVACAVNSYRTDGLVGLDQELASISVSTEADISADLRKTLQDLATFCSSAR